MKMRTLRNQLLCLTSAMVAMLATSAFAVPTIDGKASVADGYTSLSIQNTDTAFGNANTGDPINGGGGSELNQVFGKVENGRLYIVLAGNLETNFNKLDVYIDSVAGGVNQLDGANLPAGVDKFCCNVGALQNSTGLTFDAGFSADYFLTFTHGFEKVRPNTPEELEFYASSAHYADLTQGTAGAVVSAGMQLAQRGLPQVLRGTTADFNQDGVVNGTEFLTWQRNFGATEATRAQGDASGNGTVGAEDLGTWQATYGFDRTTTPYNENFFAPKNGSVDKSDVLLSRELPGLAQGDLIDKNYALGVNGGCSSDNTGTGCLTRELEFTLPALDATNAESHRNMENTIGLQMAIDNSNVAGVFGSEVNGGDFTQTTTGDPGSVTTGLEFSIPLSQIGNPAALSELKIMAFVNNGGHNYASNQFSGEGILLGNLGGDGSGAFTGTFTGLDISLLPGNQFVSLVVPGALAAVTAVPEPASAALLSAFALAGVLAGRRR